MSDTEMSQPTLLEELAGLPPQERRQLTATLRRVSETFTALPTARRPRTFLVFSPTCSPL